MFSDTRARKALTRRLRRAHLGRPLRYLDEVTSTNDVALDWSRRGAPEGATVVAASQTVGRGRFARSWYSPAGAGLWFSLVLRPAAAGLAAPWAGMLPPAVGLGVALALRSFALPAAVKWPNDVLVGRRKIAGVLVEGEWVSGRLDAAVCGVGINWSRPNGPGLETRAVTGLADEARLRPGDPPPPDEVLAAVLGHIEQVYGVFITAGSGPLVSLWPALSAHFMRRVRVSAVNGVSSVRGLSGALRPDGALDLILPGGGRDTVHSGEVHLELE